MAYVPRALRGDEEIDAQYRLAVETFMHPEAVEPIAAAFRRFDERSAGFDPEGIRGVIEGGTLLGGYFVWERMMCMGAVRLPTACIGGVVTRQDQRMRGVGRALMEDAIAHATRRQQALLLLDGVANFYGRFGYTDIFDQTAVGIDRSSIADEPVAGHRVRPAALDDAPALHDLYRRHFGPYMGSFDWTLAEKHLELDFDRERGEEPTVVEDESGAIRGYLYTDGDTNSADEAAADTWPALLALLQHHAPTAAGPPDEGPALWWRIPPDSHTAYLLAEHLALPDDRKAPVLRHRSRIRRNTDWQARPAHLPTLIHAVLPLWQQRWERSNRPYTGTIELRISEEPFWLALDSHTLQIDDESRPGSPVVAFTPQAFTQLICGYRPIRWINTLPGQHVPPALIPALEVLFPPGGFWIAGTDAF